MRPQEWYETAEYLRQRFGGRPFPVGLAQSPDQVVTIHVTGLIDDRHGPPSSQDIPCLNHPEVVNTNGLMFEHEGDPYFISAMTISRQFRQTFKIYDRSETLWQLPAGVRGAILAEEPRLMDRLDDPNRQHDLLQAFVDMLRVDIGYDDLPMTVRHFNSSRQLQALRTMAPQANFFLLCTIIMYASQQTEWKGRRPYREYRDWMRLKDQCLNQLIHWYYKNRRTLFTAQVFESESGLIVIGSVRMTLVGEAVRVPLCRRHIPLELLDQDAWDIVSNDTEFLRELSNDNPLLT